MKIVIEIDNLKESHVIALEDMLRVWELLGSWGASRWTAFYADGDGDFRPTIRVNGKRPRRFINPYHIDIDNYRIDPDEISLLLHNYKADEIRERLTSAEAP